MLHRIRIPDIRRGLTTFLIGYVAGHLLLVWQQSAETYAARADCEMLQVQFGHQGKVDGSPDKENHNFRSRR